MTTKQYDTNFPGNPYGSMNDLYDTHYEYEFDDFQSTE